MNITIQKDSFFEKISIASHFTSGRLSSLLSLQGVLLKGEKKTIHIYSTNLNFFYHTVLKTENDHKFKILIEPKSLIEFLSLLMPGKIEIEIHEKKLAINQGKTRGLFPLLPHRDFPFPPEPKEQKKTTIKPSFLIKNIPLVLFAASGDQTRPVLSGIDFVSQEEELVLVSTDGFRLSLLRLPKESDIPSFIIPASFLGELLHFVKEKENISFEYLPEEKTVCFKTEDNEFFTRLIDGEFPPYEKVIPTEIKTTVIADREDFLRNIKLISVFAKNTSNIIVIHITKNGLQIKPKTDTEDENTTSQEANIEGDDQKVAFNYKFVLDFLQHIEAKKIKIEIVRSDAPVVFKSEDNNNFLHVIMPVRIN
jgi:DNA polymerase-3 subunit beta